MGNSGPKRLLLWLAVALFGGGIFLCYSGRVDAERAEQETANLRAAQEEAKAAQATREDAKRDEARAASARAELARSDDERFQEVVQGIRNGDPAYVGASTPTYAPAEPAPYVWSPPAEYSHPQRVNENAGHDVNVQGYTRRDGTYVAPYTRAAPGHGGGRR